MIEHQPVVARLSVPGVAGARRAGRVQQDARVVDHASAAGARPQLDGAHPAPAVQVGRQHEVAVDVVAPGRQRKRRRHRNYQVRRSELPIAGRARRRREVGGVAFRRAGRCPPGEESDFRVRQAPLVPEAAVAERRLPRRHPPRGGDLGDRRRPRARRRVGRQAERADAVRPVAPDAVGMEDRRDVPGERHGANLFGCSSTPARGAGGARSSKADDDERRGDAGDESFVSRHGARGCGDRRSISRPADRHAKDVSLVPTLSILAVSLASIRFAYGAPHGPRG